MNTSELSDIEHLLRVALHIAHSLPAMETMGRGENTIALVRIQKKLLEKLEALVDKAGGVK